MSFPAYPDYKDSGVSWLGAVPSHWELSRIGSRFAERREKVSDTDFPPLSVTKHGIVPQLETAAKTDDNDNRKCVLAGDFVINSRSDRKGSSGLSPLDGSVSLINTVITPDETIHGPFVHHLLRSVAFQEEYYRYGKGIVADLWSTNYGEMKAITLAVPPIGEQVTIAAFLDRETAKIDALVAEQERLIALLKEKRAAVISHAVTKGLNPNAPLKDSGIEWLGEIPAHWEVVALKRLGSLRSGEAITSDQIEDDGEFPVYGGNGFRGYTTAYTHEGDYVLIGRQGALCGNINYARGQFWASEHAIVVNPVRKYSLVWLGELLRHMNLGQHSQSAAQPGLSAEFLSNLYVPVPPTAEQDEIAALIAERINQSDDLANQAQFAITLLQERRAALISAAVTGKIDVRGLVDPSSEMEAA